MNNMKKIVRMALMNKRIYALLVLSLVVSLSTFILISANVSYNKAYDKHFKNYKNIYRITSNVYTNNELLLSQPRCQRIMGKTIEQYHPAVLQSGFLCKTIDDNYKIANNLFVNSNVFHCSSEFLQLFSISVLQGEKSDLLTRPNVAIVSESFAQKYFGSESPIGKIINQYPANSFEIEAVYKDIPANTHFRADFLLSFHDNMHLPPPLKNEWGELGFYTYLEIDNSINIEDIENELNTLSKEHNQGLFEKSNTEYKFKLQAIKDIHTKSHLKNELGINIRGDYLSIISLVGFLIMIVSGFNYIYYSQAQIANSSVKYGVQKIFGVTRRSLFMQFLIESVFIHLVALVMSISLIIMLKYFSFSKFIYTGIDLLPNVFWISLFGVFVSSVLINPLIVFYKIYRQNSLALLSFKKSEATSGFSFRQVLTVVQFVVVVFLISAVFGIDKQVSFLRTKEKGMELADRLVLKTPSHLRRTSSRVNNINSFEQELLKIPGVINLSASNIVPGEIPSFSFNMSEQIENDGIKTALFIADNNFLELYGIELIEGFSFASENNNKGCIINKTCLEKLGYKEPSAVLGKKIFLTDESGFQNIQSQVIGVCNDFNLTSVKEHPDPIVLLDWTANMLWGKYTLMLNSESDKNMIIAKVEKLFYKTFPNYPFEYFWSEDLYNKQFAQENTIISSLKKFTIIAIILGMLSMFSMALHMSIIRSKEISIRKINGAKQLDIIKMLNIDFLKWIVLASIIAMPISWYFLVTWLSAFPYKADINLWNFIIPTAITFFIGLFTISWQTAKAANLNPIDSIKSE